MLCSSKLKFQRELNVRCSALMYMQIPHEAKAQQGIGTSGTVRGPIRSIVCVCQCRCGFMLLTIHHLHQTNQVADDDAVTQHMLLSRGLAPAVG